MGEREGRKAIVAVLADWRGYVGVEQIQMTAKNGLPIHQSMFRRLIIVKIFGCLAKMFF